MRTTQRELSPLCYFSLKNDLRWSYAPSTGASASRILALKRSKRDRHAQEPCRYGGAVPALILTVKQIFELFLELSGSTGLLCSLEGVHGGSVVGSEDIHQSRRLAGEVEGEGVPREGDLLGRNSGSAKPITGARVAGAGESRVSRAKKMSCDSKS